MKRVLSEYDSDSGDDLSEPLKADIQINNSAPTESQHPKKKYADTLGTCTMRPIKHLLCLDGNYLLWK